MRIPAVIFLMMLAYTAASHLTCTLCEPGTFCYKDNSTQCPEHSNSSFGAATLADCVCVSGFYEVANECLPCPTDHFCVAGSEASTQCPPNTVAPQYSLLLEQCLCIPGYTGNSSAGCLQCPVGTYKIVPGTESCILCAENTYSSGLARITPCDQCPVHTVSVVGSDEAVDCKSAAGYYDDGNGVKECPTGTHQALSGQAECQLCGSGTYSTAKAATSIATCASCPADSSSLAGSTSASACLCNAGFHGPNGGPCVACAAGTAKSVLGDIDCTICPADTYSTTAAAVCTACGIDASAAVNSSACLCDVGHYALMESCVSCDSGTFKSMVGNQTCSPCAMGSFSVLGGVTCDLCSINTYTDTPASSQCKVCPDHSVAPEASTDVSACQCTPGYGSVDGECVQCTYGSYKDVTSNVACVSCAVGWFTNVLGATDSTQCLECGFDSFVLDGQCQPCPSNAEAPSASSSKTACQCSSGFGGFEEGEDCTACPSGTFKSSVGSGTCDACPRGYIGNAITPRTGVESCVSCPADTYEQDNVQCHRCTMNSSSPMGSVSWHNCTCDKGFQGNYAACHACPAGTYKNWTGTGGCELCSWGKFNHLLAATSPAACVDCHAHSIQLSPPPYTTSSGCNCLAGYEPEQGTCVACQAGTWKWEGDFSCQPCPANTYYPVTLPPYDSFLCQPCPVNSSSVHGSSGIAACVCVRGFLRTQDACAQCPADGFCPNQTTYTSCPMHKTSPAGSWSVVRCACEPGYFGPAGASNCAYCPTNHYCPGDNSLIACPVNSTTNAHTRQTNITACRCSPGFYETPDGACLECPVDSYCSHEQKIKCPPNSSSTAMSDSLDECLCDEGFQLSSGVCGECPDTVLCLGGGIESQQCAAGAVVTDSACVCALGTWCVEPLDGNCFTTCEICPIDSWCASNAKHVCSSGRHAMAGSDEILDCICAAGFYDVDTRCEICPRNHYCFNGEKQSCAAFDPSLITLTTGNSDLTECHCDYGLFRLNQYDTCKLCPANFYCPYGGMFMLPNVVACAENEHTRSEGSAYASECICDAGFAMSETSENSAGCVACEPGQRCQNGFVVEFMCHIMNRVPNADHTKCICMPSYGEYESTCHMCAPGSFKSEAGDYPCHYCPMNSFWVNSTYCAPCPELSQSDPGSLSCTCNKPYIMQNGQCVGCEVDTFYDDGVCAECPQNSTSPTGAPDILACTCEHGHFRVEVSNGTRCVACPANTFERAGQCVSCGEKATSLEGSVDAAACQCDSSKCQIAVWGWDCEGMCEAPPPPCTECAAGYSKNIVSAVGNTAKCLPCGVATYQPNTNATSCVACASTESHVLLGQRNVSSCECVAGHEPTSNPASPCRQCSMGFFKSERGDWPCVACAVGSFADSNGSLACTTCASESLSASRRGVNTTTDQNSTSFADCTCAAGHYLANFTTHTECVPCVPGSFKANKGTHECTFCGAIQPHMGTSYEHHYGVNHAGAVSDSHCLTCPAYSGQDHSVVHADGYILDDWTDCLCFGGHDNLTRMGCRSCPEYQFKVGYSRAWCTFCANGTYFTTRFQECGTCELRVADSASDLHVGLAINRHDPALQWGVDEADCACHLGYERIADRCHQCPLGQFRGTRTARQCGVCAPDTYTNTTGALKCRECPIHSTTLGREGTSVVTGCICDAGYQWNVETLECDACPAGTFRSPGDVSNETLACVTCPSDHYSLAQADACTPCPAHERADAGAPSLDHCNCVPGFGDNGAGGCALCPNATFSAGGDEDGNRHPACVDCPAHRNSTRGSTLVVDCLCVPGYGAGPGACVPCADGSYSVGGHNNSCTSCGWGAISEPPLAATSFDACLCNAAIGVYES